jgi:hypothetical protein
MWNESGGPSVSQVGQRLTPVGGEEFAVEDMLGLNVSMAELVYL